MSERKSTIKNRLRDIAAEAISLQGPMTSKQISDYAISQHKAVGWIPHSLAIPGILASDETKRFTFVRSGSRREWKMRV